MFYLRLCIHPETTQNTPSQNIRDLLNYNTLHPATQKKRNIMQAKRRTTLLTAIVVAIAAMSFMHPTASKAQAAIPYECAKNGEITIHKDINFGGEKLRVGPGLNWSSMA